ncbi:MAG: hypothetical protein JWN64_829 [Parcubacteria group bacterium]|nr:hypothetical protein [Parcubacteria group bacterium]
MNKWLKIALYTLLGLFALVGLLFTAVFVAMRFDLLNVQGSNALRNEFFLGTSTPDKQQAVKSQPCNDKSKTVCDWTETPEWNVVEGGLTKDAAVIARVSKETGIDGRIMASVVIPEQIRFFTSEREVFKRYFEPLKILGSLSQFSLGVSGIKQETAAQAEVYANDSTSPFYPGAKFADLLAYPAGTEHDAELYRRLTDDKDHYYSYLYTALYIKEIETQWKTAGFDIRNNPEALVTLFNIGFANSHPNANPQPGGAPITVGGKTYAFGELGANFYHSDKLLTAFPR